MLSFWFLSTIITLILIWAIVGALLIDYIKKKQLGSSRSALNASTFLTDFIEYFVFFIFVYCVAIVDTVHSAGQDVLVIPIAILTVFFALLTSLIIASTRYFFRKSRLS
tara:strand:- start:1263 stop:1589 length:327 start_codon:yes stop_codon:yes gene_type:complete